MNETLQERDSRKGRVASVVSDSRGVKIAARSRAPWNNGAERRGMGKTNSNQRGPDSLLDQGWDPDEHWHLVSEAGIFFDNRLIW